MPLAVGNDAVLKIVLDGSVAHSTGLWIYGGNSTLKGLVVINFVTGIYLNSSNKFFRGN